MRISLLRPLAIAVSISALLLGSCGRGSTGKTIDITVVTKALDSEWWQRVKAGAEEAARDNPGVRLAVLAPEREVNIDQQVTILEDQITKKVAALAVAPTGAAELIPVLDRARTAGIPVVIFDTDINWASKLTYVGSDNRRAGHIAGEYIVKLLGGKGKVAVIRGILGVTTHEDRVAGFRDAIRDAPGIECVAVQPANSERALAMSVMENLLTRYPDLRALFAGNDQMALGAVEAIAARNLTGKIAVDWNRCHPRSGSSGGSRPPGGRCGDVSGDAGPACGRDRAEGGARRTAGKTDRRPRDVGYQRKRRPVPQVT